MSRGGNAVRFSLFVSWCVFFRPSPFWLSFPPRGAFGNNFRERVLGFVGSWSVSVDRCSFCKYFGFIGTTSSRNFLEKIFFFVRSCFFRRILFSSLLFCFSLLFLGLARFFFLLVACLQVFGESTTRRSIAAEHAFFFFSLPGPAPPPSLYISPSCFLSLALSLSLDCRSSARGVRAVAKQSVHRMLLIDPSMSAFHIIASPRRPKVLIEFVHEL